MNVLYLSTKQGQETRDKLLTATTTWMTRKEIAIATGLTYEQIRRQTKTLVSEGLLRSQLQGRQRYYIKSSNTNSVVSA